MNTPEDPSVRCAHCKLCIPVGANVCTHCNRSQSKYRHWIARLGVYSTGLAFLGSALLFIVATLPQIWRSYIGEEIVVLSVRYDTVDDAKPDITVQNLSGSELLVGNIEFHFPNRKTSVQSTSKGLNIEVGAGEIARQARVKKQLSENRTRGVPYVSNVDRQWTVSQPAVNALLMNHGDCFSLSIEGPSENAFSLFREAIEKDKDQLLIRMPHDTTIRYFSPGRGAWRELKLDTIAILRRLDRPSCEGLISGINANVID